MAECLLVSIGPEEEEETPESEASIADTLFVFTIQRSPAADRGHTYSHNGRRLRSRPADTDIYIYIYMIYICIYRERDVCVCIHIYVYIYIYIYTYPAVHGSRAHGFFPYWVGSCLD